MAPTELTQDQRRQLHSDNLAAHVLKRKGKAVKDCTSIELISAGPATSGLMARAAHNRELSKALKIEKYQAAQDAITARYAQWESDGRPADEVDWSDGEMRLLPRGIG